MLKKVPVIFREEGFSAVPRRAWVKLLRESGIRYEEVVARCRGSYCLDTNRNHIKLTPRLGVEMKSLRAAQCIPQPVAQHYVEHRFDLLGSGWVQVRYGMRTRGMSGYHYDMGEDLLPDPRGEWLAGRLNRSNLPIARHIWQRIDSNYNPIDWQLDFKSGYRWSEQTWALRLPYGHLPGVDVKVPWELSRMQHLPQLALRAVALGIYEAEAQQLAREIRNQTLDFITTNPPGFGVNWICPMDIAIRGANWCLAWDILRAGGFESDSEDENVLAHSLYDHGHYIVDHLEWAGGRTNHYLTDICGLAFIAAYLPEERETDLWLAFSIGQLQTETLRQFLPDGGNFEGSTAYHRLSAEMVIYTVALVLGLPVVRLQRLATIEPRDYDYLPRSAGSPCQWALHETGKNAQATGSCATPLEPKFVERLQHAFTFFSVILKANGTFPQIGDSDSGRFFKLSPVYSVISTATAKRKYINLEGYNEFADEVPYFYEEGLSGIHLLEAGTALGLEASDARSIHEKHLNKGTIGRAVVSNLAAGNTLQTSRTKVWLADDVANQDAFTDYWIALQHRPNTKFQTHRYVLESDLLFHNIVVRAFEHFGCFVFKASDLYLIIRCAVQPDQKIGGHYHDDQLSIELDIEGNPLIRDPGTFVYTALSYERSRYRSASAHFSPLGLIVSPQSNATIFHHLAVQPATVEYCGPHGFAANVTLANCRCDLVIRFMRREIEVILAAGTVFKQPVLGTHTPIPYSPGYGIQEKRIS